MIDALRLLLTLRPNLLEFAERLGSAFLLRADSVSEIVRKSSRARGVRVSGSLRLPSSRAKILDAWAYIVLRGWSTYEM